MAAKNRMGIGGGPHANNNIVARREMERAEQNRLRRLSEIKTSPTGAAHPYRVHPLRPGSARRPSRPPSAPAMRSCPSSGSAVGPRQRPPSAGDELQQQLLQNQLGPYHVALSAAAAAAKSAGQRRCRSEAAPSRLQSSFMLSPQRRFDDARNHLQVNSDAERQALAEELQSWYFSSPPDEVPEPKEASDRAARPVGLPPRPPVVVPSVLLLESAAAALKAKVGATWRAH